MIRKRPATARGNAVRAGVVVLGALAFGYLTLQIGVKPFLERAQAVVDETAAHPPPHPPQDKTATRLE